MCIFEKSKGTSMTDKEAMKQIIAEIDALPEGLEGYFSDAFADNLAKVRKALAQPEPIQSLQCFHCQVTIETLNDKVMQLMAQPEQEPVAWEWRYDSCGHAVVNRFAVTETPEPTLFLKNVFARGPFPLYSHPPQRTEENL